ncbi:unnamed protein product [Musa acuminata subsp. malaccensis]|uniref:(wild Malaysian banana) hypothetical protein n=1 Tax=Musa acuminata subsp. malaccensis TaxID=214687 RepID=A0A804KT59_MUSAM|nr:unnamed protein product [Musa acuminata subsp. malaccensis]
MDKGPLLPKCSWEARRSLPWAHWKYLAEDASCLLENSTRVVGLDIDRHSWGPSNQSISLRSRTTSLLIERERENSGAPLIACSLPDKLSTSLEYDGSAVREILGSTYRPETSTTTCLINLPRTGIT